MAAKSFTCFTCSSHNVVMSELMSFRQDSGTARDREASPESGHLASPPWLYQRTVVAPFWFTGALTFTQSQENYTFPMILHSEMNLLYPVRFPRRGGDGETCDSLVFLSLYKLNEVQMSLKSELFKSLRRLLFADGCIGQSHGSADTTKGRNSVWTPWETDSIRTQRPTGQELSAFFSPQSNLQLDPVRGDVFFTSVCFVCRAVVNTSSALFMSRNQPPPPPLGLYTVPYRLPRFQL